MHWLAAFGFVAVGFFIGILVCALGRSEREMEELERNLFDK